MLYFEKAILLHLTDNDVVPEADSKVHIKCGFVCIELVIRQLHLHHHSKLVI